MMNALVFGAGAGSFMVSVPGYCSRNAGTCDRLKWVTLWIGDQEV